MSLNFKTGAGVIFVISKGKGCQGQKINTISVFQNIQIGITGTNPNYRCHTTRLSCRCPQPENIVISPLDIQRMIVFQTVHNLVRPRSPVINISQNVQMIYHQSLNQLRQCHNKLLCSPNFNDGLNNLLIVGLLVHNIRTLCNQLFYHIGKILRQSFVHLRSGIFGRCFFTHLNQAVQGNFIPFPLVTFLHFHQIHLFPWIINQRSKASLFLFAHGMPKYGVDFSPHRTGAIL